METASSAKKHESLLLHECINLGRGDRLVGRYWNTVYFTVRKTFVLKGARFAEEDAEDLRNEVFLQLFEDSCRKLRQYDPARGLSLAGWIKMIAAQTVIVYIRKRDRAGRLGLRDTVCFDGYGEEAGNLHAQDTETLIARLDAREKLRQVKENIGKLSCAKRMILDLYFRGGLSFDEIASLTGRTIGNIYTIKSRAAEELRGMMAGA